MKTGKLVWIPRILLILMNGFIAIFAFDVFEGSEPVIVKLLGLLVHLIPNFLMLAVLIVAWIKPIIGGILCIILGVIIGAWFKVWSVFTPEGEGNIFTLILVLIIIAIGIMFIAFGKPKEKAF